MPKNELIDALAGKPAKGQKLRTGQHVRVLINTVTYKKNDEVIVLYSYAQHYGHGDANTYAVTGKYGHLSWLDYPEELSTKFPKQGVSHGRGRS